MEIAIEGRSVGTFSFGDIPKVKRGIEIDKLSGDDGIGAVTSPVSTVCNEVFGNDGSIDD